MRVLVNSDNSVNVPSELAGEIAETVEKAMRLFADDITRIEVHLGDVNADRGGAADKRCLLEARLAGLKPIAVDHHASTLQQAFNGALTKLQRNLESTQGKLRGR
jgi:ribosome-associated translation inhibitor RaiA